MREDFRAIWTSSGTPQARGHALETFLGRMARFSGLQVTGALRVKGTQIDGTVKHEGENHNIAAKWEHHAMSDEPVPALCRELEMNMHGCGIFISVNGFSARAQSILERPGSKNAVLVDGEDITLVLHELVTFPELLDRKTRAAQTRGQFYIHPITGTSKIKVAAREETRGVRPRVRISSPQLAIRRLGDVSMKPLGRA